MDVPVAANVLGTLGAVCWSVQLIPQIVVNHRRHDTTGLQPTMMLLWAVAGVPLGVYNIVQSFNIALQIQPQILTLLSLLTWAQCKHYGVDPKWSWLGCLTTVVLLASVMGGIEIGLVFGLRQAAAHGIQWPSKFMAILSAVLLSAGVLRHYWDIYKERTVRGISFIFVGIDAMGDLTSLISILFQPELDILGMVIYGSELVLWLGVFTCGGWFNLRPYVKQRLQTRSASGSPAIHNAGHVDIGVASFRPDIDDGAATSRPSSTVFRTASNRSSEHGLRLRSLPL